MGLSGVTYPFFMYGRISTYSSLKSLCEDGIRGGRALVILWQSLQCTIYIVKIIGKRSRIKNRARNPVHAYQMGQDPQAGDQCGICNHLKEQ